MRYGIEVVDGVELTSGSSPLPEGAIEPIPDWEDLVELPYYYLKVENGVIVEKTEAEKTAYDEAHPPTVEELQVEAQAYLNDSDWYVVRKADPSSGAAVPQDVLDERGSARDIL